MFLGLVIVFQNYKVVFTGGLYVGAGFLLLVTQHTGSFQYVDMSVYQTFHPAV